MSDAAATRESTQSVIVECELDEPPEKVWKALTVPELVAAWLMPNDINPELGKSFSFQAKPIAGGDIACEVLAVEPNRLLSYSWRGAEGECDGDARRLDTVVTFELSETETGGTHLRLVHVGLPLASARPVTALLASARRSTSCLSSARRLRHRPCGVHRLAPRIARPMAGRSMRWAA
jgi:uncharacterized protein YndB with AHSA1/START domain